jgi:hypothetical protein
MRKLAYLRVAATTLGVWLLLGAPAWAIRASAVVTVWRNA